MSAASLSCSIYPTFSFPYKILLCRIPLRIEASLPKKQLDFSLFLTLMVVVLNKLLRDWRRAQYSG